MVETCTVSRLVIMTTTHRTGRGMVPRFSFLPTVPANGKFGGVSFRAEETNRITHHGGYAANESYDAKTLYYTKQDRGGIWSTSTGGGEEQRLTKAPHQGYWGHFSVTETGLYLVDSDADLGPTIMYYSFQNGRLKPTLILKQAPLRYTYNVASSRDGKAVYFA